MIFPKLVYQIFHYIILLIEKLDNIFIQDSAYILESSK